jgi:hypothetical protein
MTTAVEQPTAVKPGAKLITITCAKRGCRVKRAIHPQDAFQVRYCREHQREAARQRAKEQRAAKPKARSKS